MMSFSLNVHSWFALAPGLTSPEDWFAWSETAGSDRQAGSVRCRKIPMMDARRMSLISKLAVECGLNLLALQPDAVVCTSRHGELARTYKVLDTIVKNADVSPTDFAMSVHNTAAGLLTIISRFALPVTSLAAGIDGFQQGLLEVQAMFAGGAKRVLLIDFDDDVPDFYRPFVAMRCPAYAVGLLLTPGPYWYCQSVNHHDEQVPQDDVMLPQSLTFLRHWLQQSSQFEVKGNLCNWRWIQQEKI